MGSPRLGESTPVQMGLNGTTINGMDIQVEITINSSSDLTTENSLYLLLLPLIVLTIQEPMESHTTKMYFLAGSQMDLTENYYLSLMKKR